MTNPAIKNNSNHLHIGIENGVKRIIILLTYGYSHSLCKITKYVPSCRYGNVRTFYGKMSFLNPFLLIAVLAVAVPLLIHLINLRRPKKVRFSTLTFFEYLKASTLQRIRIKRLLLMFLRMVAILMLCFALARPFIPSDSGGAVNSDQPAVIGIIIDNSPSMGQVDHNGPFLDQAKRIAGRIIENAKNEDRILIEVTNGASLDQPALNRSAAQALVENLTTLNKGNFINENLESILYRLEQAPQPQKKLYLVTDGQSSQMSPLLEYDYEVGEEKNLSVITVGEDTQANVAITDISLESEVLSRSQPVIVTVRVENFSRLPIRNHFLSLDYRDEMAGQHLVNLEPDDVEEFSFEIIPGGDGSLAGSFILEGDEMTFDNRRYFSIRIPEKRRVLLVQDQPSSGSSFASYLSPVLDAALSADELLEIESVTWDSEIFSGGDIDALILDSVERIPEYVVDDLVSYLQMGGGILFLPSPNGEIRSYNRFLERTGVGRFDNITGSYGSFQTIDRVTDFREGHPVLEEIFEKSDDEELRVNLPEIFYHFRLETSGGSGLYRLLNSERGEAVLVEQQFGDGRMMVSSIGADPGWSNFPVKPIFAPLFYRSVLYLATSESGGLMEHVIGDRFEFQLPGSPVEVLIEVGEQRIIPERRTVFQGLVVSDEARDWSPGFAELSADGEKYVIALNQYAMESDFTALEDVEIVQFLDEFFNSVSVLQISGSDSEVAEQIQAAGLAREIWFWFILGAIILLLTESAVSRLFKAESIK